MHYTVGVFFKKGEFIDELMEPYYEDSLIHSEFVDISEELKEEFEIREEKRKVYEGKYFSHFDSELDHLTIEEKDNLEEKLVKINELFENVNEYAESVGFYKNEDGKYGFYRNPNAKYDWYQLGGRWRGMLLVKEGDFSAVGEAGAFGDKFEEKPVPEGYQWTDVAKVSDIQWELMKELSKERRKKLYDKATELGEKDKVYKYGIKEGETREEYSNRNTEFSTYSILHDGNWVDIEELEDTEKENYFKTFIENAGPDLIMAVIDCHI